MLSTCKRGLSQRRTHKRPNGSGFELMTAFMSHIISNKQGTKGYFLAKIDLILCVTLTVTLSFSYFKTIITLCEDMDMVVWSYFQHRQ